VGYVGDESVAFAETFSVRPPVDESTNEAAEKQADDTGDANNPQFRSVAETFAKEVQDRNKDPVEQRRNKAGCYGCEVPVLAQTPDSFSKDFNSPDPPRTDSEPSSLPDGRAAAQSAFAGKWRLLVAAAFELVLLSYALARVRDELARILFAVNTTVQGVGKGITGEYGGPL
jgi:hypothetical protein